MHPLQQKLEKREQEAVMATALLWSATHKKETIVRTTQLLSPVGPESALPPPPTSTFVLYLSLPPHPPPSVLLYLFGAQPPEAPAWECRKKIENR